MNLGANGYRLGGNSLPQQLALNRNLRKLPLKPKPKFIYIDFRKTGRRYLNQAVCMLQSEKTIYAPIHNFFILSNLPKIKIIPIIQCRLCRCKRLLSMCVIRIGKCVSVLLA